MKQLVSRPFSLFLIFFLGITFSLHAQYATNIEPKGFGSWGCFGTAMAEAVIPGSGYALSGQYDKAAIFGSVKLYSHYRTAGALGDKDFVKNPLKIVEKKDPNDPTKNSIEQTFYYNRPNVDAELYFRTGINSMALNVYDFYTYGCQKNTGTYYRLLDPINIFHVYDKWYFWAFLSGVLWISKIQGKRKIIFKLGGGLTEDEVKILAYRHYFVAIGEETLFRGVIQSGFYSWYQGLGLSKTASRYAGIASASVIFGAAHTGESGSATPTGAFLMGLIYGMMYQPDNETFDVTTPTATHFFNNFIAVQRIFNDAKFHVSGEPVVKPSLVLPFSVRY